MDSKQRKATKITKSPQKLRPNSPPKSPPKSHRGGLSKNIVVKDNFLNAIKASTVKVKVPKTRMDLNKLVWEFVDKSKNSGRIVSFDSWKDTSVRDALGIKGDVPIFDKNGLASYINTIILND